MTIIELEKVIAKLHITSKEGLNETTIMEKQH